MRSRQQIAVSIAQGPIEGWTHEDVLQWLQYRGLERYEAALRSITGKVCAMACSSPLHDVEQQTKSSF